MIRYHAVMLDETGCEFGATIEAENKSDAWDKAKEDYPESRCVQLESPEDTAEREARIYRQAQIDVDGYDPSEDQFEDDDFDDAFSPAYDSEGYYEEEPVVNPVAPIYKVIQDKSGQWLMSIHFPDQDPDNFGPFDTEDEAIASAEQWLDEYNHLGESE